MVLSAFVAAPFIFFVSATFGTGLAVIDGPTSAAVSGAQAALEEEPVDEREIEREVHRFVNEERTDRGYDPVEFDDSIREVARAHSEDMATRGYFAHESPGGDGHPDRYDLHGVACGSSAENIAWTLADGGVKTSSGERVDHDRDETSIARGLVRQWMTSPGHRENLLSPDWQAEGVGVSLSETDDGVRVYATQNFCERSP